MAITTRKTWHCTETRYRHQQSVTRRNEEGKRKKNREPESVVRAIAGIDRIFNNVESRNCLEYPQVWYSYTIIPQWQAWDTRGHIV